MNNKGRIKEIRCEVRPQSHGVQWNIICNSIHKIAVITSMMNCIRKKTKIGCARGAMQASKRKQLN